MSCADFSLHGETSLIARTPACSVHCFQLRLGLVGPQHRGLCEKCWQSILVPSCWEQNGPPPWSTFTSFTASPPPATLPPQCSMPFSALRPLFRFSPVQPELHAKAQAKPNPELPMRSSQWYLPCSRIFFYVLGKKAAYQVSIGLVGSACLGNHQPFLSFSRVNICCCAVCRKWTELASRLWSLIYMRACDYLEPSSCRDYTVWENTPMPWLHDRGSSPAGHLPLSPDPDFRAEILGHGSVNPEFTEWGQKE